MTKPLPKQSRYFIPRTLRISMKTQLARKIYFNSSHLYFNKKWDSDKNEEVFGPHHSKYGHGHDYTLEAYITGPIDLETGMIMNLQSVDEILKNVTSPLHHRYLNQDVEEFKSTVPTTENLAKYCFEKIQEQLPDPSVQLDKVRLYETEDLWVDYGNLS